MLKKARPADVIALVLISGYMFLQWRGVETMLTSAVLLVVGFYFGRSTPSATN